MTIVHPILRWLSIFCCLVGCAILFVFVSAAASAKKGKASPSFFCRGECLEYQVYYGLVHGGTATMRIDEALHDINGHTCYKASVQGISGKALKLLGMSVANTWVSYLDANLLRPCRFIGDIQENKYVKKEQIDFDYTLNQAKVEVVEGTDHNMERSVGCYPFSSATQIHDLVSAYYALRAIDVKKIKVGEKITFNIIHDKEIYANATVIFLGKKIISTQWGKVVTVGFSPLIPLENSIFSGDRPIEIFISDDANKVPVKLKVNLALGGAVNIDLTNYTGLKGTLAFQ